MLLKVVFNQKTMTKMRRVLEKTMRTRMRKTEKVLL
jgi:hypothetical protein